MRVLMVHCEFVPQSSGVARHIFGLAKALQDHHEVTPVVLAKRVLDDDVPFQVVKGGFRELPALVSRCDLVHAHGARTPISALAVRLARWQGRPSVFTPHCYYDGGGAAYRACKAMWDRWVERGTHARCGASIALHRQWPAAMAAKGFHPARMEVIPNCIDSQAFRNRLAAVPLRLSGRPALLSVGRLDPVKRLDVAIRCLTAPGMERAELHLVGQGGDEVRLRGQAAAAGLADRVHFRGWCSDDQTAAMMRGCDAMVLASEREGLPTVALEALLAGIPMVLSDIDGNRAIADAVGWPHLFPLGDHLAMAASVQACAARPVPETVVAAIEKEFSWQSRAADVHALYLDLLGW